MKKSILVILLVLLAFSLWSVLAVAKERVAQKPTQVQKTEPNVAPEAFPNVMQPKVQPVRTTPEDFKRILEKKGWTTDMVKSWSSQNTYSEPEEAAAEKELVPTLCTIYNIQGLCCYRGTAAPAWIRCYGDVITSSYQNPEDSSTGVPSCGQPVYPFIAYSVGQSFNNQDTCTLLLQPEIREALYDASGCAYPGAALLTGPVYTIARTSLGSFTTYLPLGDSICLYKPWFATMHFLNSDDFSDPTYCPSGNPAYLSWTYDLSGRFCQSYWAPYGGYYGDFDVVINGIEGGAIQVRTRGYNRVENTCLPPADPWYFKDSLLAAPCGVPDFDQYQFGPGTAFCGPTAEANSYWWLNAKWGFDMVPGSPTIPAIINEIAAAAGTSPVTGTNVTQLQAGILQVIISHGGWWFAETTVYKPDFWYLQKELKKCEDLTLLLGFWQEVTPGVWERFGGHFVTIAGVDIYTTPPRFAISDPALDNAEANFPNPVFGMVCHLGDPFPHVGNPLIHNNPGNTSHDFYDVAWPSPSPGGYLWLPGYLASWPDFQGQNAGPFPNTVTYNSLLPVNVEVEAVVDVSPGDPYQVCYLVGGDIASSISNYGRLGPQTGVDFVWPTQTDTTNQLFDGSLCLGTSGSDMAVSVTSGKGYKPIDPCSVTDTVLYVDGTDTLKAQVGRTKYSSLGIPALHVTQTNYDFTWTGNLSDPINDVMLYEFAVENDGTLPILGINQGVFHDFDVNRHGGYNLGGGDSTVNTVWQTDTLGAMMVTLVPETEGLVSPNGTLGEQNNYLYNEVPGPYDSLYALMNVTNWYAPTNTPPPDFDWGVLLVQPKYDLAPEADMLNSYFVWGYAGLPDSFTVGDQVRMKKDAKHKLYKLLQWKGFFRGDVTGDGTLAAADVVYLINWLFKGGPNPKPMISQGDVNNTNKTDVADVIYLVNYLYKAGPAPLDKDRFMAGAAARPGLFGDSQWMNLGK